MRIAMGSDHAGFELKEILIDFLKNQRHEILDLGTYNMEPADYPDYAESVGLVLRSAHAERGILICGSGVGASVAANKIPGIRAGLCHDTYSAHQGVEHDDMNVLVMGARVIGPALAQELASAFVGAVFTGEKRHQSRLEKIQAMEVRYGNTNKKASS